MKPGVDRDMGDGDAWPGIRSKILDADILVFATPTWMGHPSSVANGVLERLDAEISEGTLIGKVAIAAIVGNEDGAHQIFAELTQALNDVGFTIPAQGGTYWNGEAMGTVDYIDLPETPENTAAATKAAAANAAHLAGLLTATPYPS